MAVTPLMIDLTEQHAVIVGGGRVAERRAATLLAGGAFVTVISPHLSNGLQREWEKGQILWKQKLFEATDIYDAFIVIVATDNPKVNESVINAASPNMLVNAAGEAEQGNVVFPSFFRRGKLSISVSTNGASPQLSAKIKKDLQGIYSENYEGYLDFLAESRKLIKRSRLDPHYQQLLLKELLSESFFDENKQLSAMVWFRKLAKEGEAG
ncbi:NAD(P)-binding protein [Virgibacillus sediminis]|uniref:precorrin-2 dehydrogenase n=1 Tax=Virgibacillus sediminis TaxID=202260 RepID=A0ABV7A316_9BACI